MRTLSSLLRREVVTESGRSLGRCYDLRGELSPTSLRITGLCVGRRGLLEHLGIRAQKPHTVIPWRASCGSKGSGSSFATALSPPTRIRRGANRESRVRAPTALNFDVLAGNLVRIFFAGEQQ